MSTASTPAQHIKVVAGASLLLVTILSSYSLSYAYSCFGLFFGAIVWGAMALSFIDTVRYRKECLGRCYFADESLVSRLYRSVRLSGLYYLGWSLLLTLAILSALSLGNYPAYYLAFHIPLGYALYTLLGRLLAGHVHEKYRRLLSREWSIAAMTLAGVPLLMLAALESPLPQYLDTSLNATIENAAALASSACPPTDIYLDISARIDAALWWLVYNATQMIPQGWLVTVTWLGFILYNTLTLLALNRLIVQAIYLTEKILHKES